MTRQGASNRVLILGVVFLSLGLLLGYILLFSQLEEARRSFADLGFGVVVVSFVIAGSFVTIKEPLNLVGWMLTLFGFFALLGSFLNSYALYAIAQQPHLPFAGLAGAVDSAAGDWVPPLFLMFALLLFPNGKLPSRRWRWLAVVIVLIYGGAFLAQLFRPGLTLRVPIENPLGIPGTRGAMDALRDLAGIALGPLFIATTASLFVRRRRASGIERHQLKWLFYVTSLLAFDLILGIVVESLGVTDYDWVGVVLFATSLVGIPVAIAIAILKYRLYDIDVVINKTLVFGALATFITGIYVAVVVGVGELLGSSDEPNLALSIAATAIVAIAFQPVRDRVERVANRLVYGIRRTPYEVLAEFSERVATSYETHEVTPAMAHTLQEATGAARAEVWLALDSTLVLSASTEAERTGDDVIALEGSGIDAIDADEVVAVTHHDELLGALAIAKDRAEPVTAADRRLLADLAAQAGIVLRNARLTAELQARLDEISVVAEQIRESRRRIVAAQDQARRRLERDIHDGAQQHLVALAVKLNLARTMAERKPERAGAMLDQLDSEMGDALETLSDLARGIYPPLLRERGIAAALEARGASAPFELAVIDRTSARADEATEAAIYFCCLEALQNVAKYAGATSVTVELGDVEGGLSFCVSDDGRGFVPDAVEGGSGLQGMSDRLAAVGGVVEIRSRPGRGTTVEGRIGVREVSRA